MNRREMLAGAVLGLPGIGLALRAAAADGDDVDVMSTPPPEGAVVLFDGRDLSGWVNRRGGTAAGWKVENGYMEVAAGNGDIHTRETFTDFRLHLEFWLPYMPDARGQARANSGVYLQGRYEIQVLDSYGLESKIDDCGALYSIAPPRVNACKKPETWQSYDITFRAPRFGEDGSQSRQGSVTVRHNGVLIHERQRFDAGVTPSGLDSDPRMPGPILLQDHSNPVRYRNVWLVRRQGRGRG